MTARDDLAVVVLAAGKGTRFTSDLAKVLHRAAGRTLLGHVLEAVRPLGAAQVVVVVGHQAPEVEAAAKAADVAGLTTVVQADQLGTGHATEVAMDVLDDGVARVLVLPGDTPLLTTATLEALVDAGGDGAAMLTALLGDPTGYGRVVRDGESVAAIVEHGDASDEQRAIAEINAGMYLLPRPDLARYLADLGDDNAQGERYLTDVVAARVGEGGAVNAIVADASEVAGVNDRVQLADAAAVLRQRILEAHMRAGVSIIDPAATYIDAGVEIGTDTVVLPGCHLEGATRIGAGVEVGPDCRLVDVEVEDGARVTYAVLWGASVGPEATVGPYTYLRPGTRLERGAKAGGFVEIKKTTVGENSKVPHLSYIGDATIGRDVNVGAGTITCNFDGFDKHETTIGDGAFIGSDTMLVAPVDVGAGAVTGAGSAITRDVPEDALAVERSDQRTIEGWAGRRRDRRA